ncbi:hypothetical protein FSP39_018593 [Pinctada imbricata]|uniref:HOOK N-terminal domain-containing protein n=1 Tax=Pinctada imbricata TaxID=66713 RepID=A0AA88XWC6_PINIB|nr:hypothetical protein FSP39_018593 [Pinctada imbricata]
MTSENLMEIPLVAWVESFNDGNSLEYKDLYDGVFLNDVMLKIDPRPANYQGVNRAVEDANIRLQNWDILIKNIRAFYQEVLQQLIIMKLPNIHAICREPEKDASMNEIRKALLLILGCAVQCERKEYFINVIKQLDVTVQEDIVEHIKEITDDSECVLSIEPSEQLEVYVEKVFNHLTRVLKERDKFAEASVELAFERDYYQSHANKGSPVLATPPTTPEKQHLMAELTECKARIRKLRQEVEEKQENLAELQEEVEDKNSTLSKLKTEITELRQDSRMARTLRDELDVLREKLGKADSNQNVIQKYKEKMNELEFYKTRVEELREDNSILVETKSMLEEQLSNSHKRVETVVELEKELIKKKQVTQQMMEERECDMEKIRILTEENAQLQFKMKSSMNESTSLEAELESARLKTSGLNSTLSNQLTETTNAKILRLELENRRLSQQLEDMKENAVIENTALTLQLEKENQRLTKKVEKLQENDQGSAQKMYELEQLNDQLQQDKEQMSQMMEKVKESSDRQIKELERENDNLSHTVEVIRARNEQTNDARVKDLERENKRLSDQALHKDQRISKLEYESRQLQKSYNKLKHNCDRISELETENANLDKENLELHKTVSTLKLTCDKFEKLEQENSDLEVENRKLQKTVDTLHSQLQKREALEQEHINLSVENQKLQRTIDLMKNSTTKIAEVENEKDSLNREIQQLKRSLEAQKSVQNKNEQMELDLMDLDNENIKLQKSLEITTNRVQQLERDNSDLELENEKLQKVIEKMKMSNKRLEDMEKQSTELEEEISTLKRSKNVMEKENKRLKHSVELKDNSLDDLSAKFSALERDHRSLKTSASAHKDTTTRVRDLEKENRELFQESSMHKKTVSTLREDLVNEKIKSQQLSNELDKLSHDLEKFGINTEKLAQVNMAQDDRTRTEDFSDSSSADMELQTRNVHEFDSHPHQNDDDDDDTVDDDDGDDDDGDDDDDDDNGDNDDDDDDDGYNKDNIPEKVIIENEKNLEESRDEGVVNEYYDDDENDFQNLKEKVIVRYKALESMMEETLKRSMQIKEEKIHSLESRLEESKNRNQRLHEEVRIMKRECESLKQRFEEESMSKQESQLLQGAPTRNRSQASSRDLDRLVQVERTNASLMVENSNLKSQTNSLNEQIKKLESQHSHLQSQNSSLQDTNSAFQAKNAKLQVENSTLQSQCSSLSSQNSSLQSNLHRLESEHQHLIQTHEELQSSHEQLLQDHESLQSIHEKLSSDYESVISEHGSLKSVHKALKNENKELHEQLTRYLHGHDNLSQIQDKLSREKDMMQSELKSMRNLQEENRRRNEDNNQLRGELRSTTEELKKVKTEYNTLQLRSQELASQCNEYKDQLHAMEIEINTLAHKYDAQYQINQMMEEDNNNLLLQVKALINTNKDLLDKIINNKEHFSEEEKSYLEKLNDLNRQKERLEEKIMDYYKRQENHKKNKGLGARIARKAAKIFVSKNPRSKSRTNLTDISADNTSQGSGSMGDTADADVSRKSGAKSSEDLLTESTVSNTDRDSHSSSKSAGLLPGMGRPASLGDEEEDDGGFGRSKETSDQMLTLEEFLNEANRTSPQKLKQGEGKRQDDADSKSSENSDNSASRRNQRKRAPQPPLQTPSNRISASIPDVAAVSHLDISRMSHISAGSSGSGHDSRPDDYATPPQRRGFVPPDTSTPAQPVNGLHKHSSFEDLQPSIFTSVPQEFRRQTLSSTPSTASRTLQYSFNTSPQSQNNSVRSLSRELPPTPGDSGNRLNPSERLDRLMASGAMPNSSSPNTNNADRSMNSSRDSYDQSVISGNLSDKPPQPNTSSQGGRAFMRTHNQWGKSQPPNTPVRAQHSVAMRNGPSMGSQNNMERVGQNVSMNSGNPRRLSMHEGNTSQQNIYSSIDDLKNRNNNDFSPSNSQSNGPVRNSYGSPSENHYARVQKIERPKSVPPNMFHQIAQQQQQQSGNSPQDYTYSQPQKATPPVPPPRRTGRVLREPNQTGRQILASKNSPNFQSSSGRQLPGAELTRSQTPNIRIGPSQKSTNNTPPAPKPLPNEPKDPKENSVWYEYGCV